MQGTLSHVAIGDITMTNMYEYYFNAYLMWTCTFVYVYLFSNIAGIVSNLSSEIHVDFLKRRNKILEKLTNDKIPKEVIHEINLYFDY